MSMISGINISNEAKFRKSMSRVCMVKNRIFLNSSYLISINEPRYVASREGAVASTGYINDVPRFISCL